MALRYRVFPFLLALALSASPALAQSQNVCALGEAETFLENAGVRARLFNNGALFWDGSTETRYEVPKGSGIQAMFAAGIWIGGTVDGDLRFAGSDYGPYEYWPGPLAEDGGPPTQASCTAYDRIWRVTLEDVARYNTTGEATADLAEWPHEAGAPVVDGNGDPDDYDLAAGDRPAILGDETAWWIMNDLGGRHDWSDGSPIGLEVRVTASTVSNAYAQERIGLLPDLAGVFHTATLYRYDLTYRGGAPFEDAYFGLWLDPDLGFAGDDYVGSYPQTDIAFVYNGDDLDESTSRTRGYGPSPPALGYQMISGPGEKPLSHFLYYNGDSSVQGNPAGGQDAYLFLQGRWRDGTPMTFGGVGYQTGPPTDHMFDDLPPAFWSEANIDGLGTSNTPSDRRAMLSHGPFTMQPGESAEVQFALVFSRSEAGHFASARQLVTTDGPRLAAFAGILGPDPALATISLGELPTGPFPPPEPPEVPSRYAVGETVWPNPTTSDAILRLDLPDAAHVRLMLYDALGRQLAVPVDEARGAAEHSLPVPTGDLSPGLYHYRLEVTPEGQSPIPSSGRFTLIR